MKTTLPSLLVAIALSGCALLSKSDAHVSRYFTPGYDGDGAAPPAPSGLELRLGRVEGGSHLRERMAARSSAREVFYHQDRLWAERPEVYLRRALARTLFEERGVVEALSPRAVTLEIELIAFEEVLEPHKARLQALVKLRGDRVGLLEETITVEHPVAGDPGGDPAGMVVDALSRALHAGVTRIADRVIEKLGDQARPAAQ